MPIHIITSAEAFAKIQAKNPAARPASELYAELDTPPPAPKQKARKKP